MSGNPIWMRTVGGAGYDGISGLTQDSNGDLVVTGYFQNSATIAGTQLNAFDEFDQEIFVAKFDNNGNGIWATSAGGDSYDEGILVSSDANGFSYASGIFSNESNFGQLTLTSGGGHDVYLIRLDADGKVFLNPAKQPVSLVFGNYPNPAADQTRIYFELAQTATVNLKVIDLQGKIILEPIQNQRLQEGRSEVEISIESLSPGIYLYRLSTGTGQAVTGKLIVRR